MKIEVKIPEQYELEENGVFNSPIRKYDEDKFDWYDDQTEMCYIIVGEVTVTTEFESATVKTGDFVKFPKGARLCLGYTFRCSKTLFLRINDCAFKKKMEVCMKMKGCFDFVFQNYYDVFFI